MDSKRFQRYYAPTTNFRYTNPNPADKSRKTMVWNRGDCVVRALANSTGITWLESFDWLTIRARADFYVPNDISACRKWFVDCGCPWTAVKAERGKSRMTVLDFAKSHKGKYIIQIANHVCACVDGVVLDTWNCGEKAVVGYWDMSNFK